MLTDDELTAVIEGGESDRVEFKETAGSLDKIREAICAFANDLPGHGEPGLVFVGIKDDGNGTGLAITDETLQTLGGLRSDGKTLPFPNMTVEKKTLRGCAVAVIQVSPRTTRR